MKKAIWLTILFVFSTACFAASNKSVVGTWRSIDDETGKPRSIIKIVKTPSGELRGYIEKVLQIGDKKPRKLCDTCTGERKDKPIVGMNIIWDVYEEEGEYTSGQILDPKNGKVYRVSLNLINEGKSMKVRGYIGLSIFGRTQIWHRLK